MVPATAVTTDSLCARILGAYSPAARGATKPVW